MNKNTLHFIFLVAGLLTAVGVEVLAKGPWAHAVWAPTLIMLLTQLQKAIVGATEQTKKVKRKILRQPPPPPAADAPANSSPPGT